MPKIFNEMQWIKAFLTIHTKKLPQFLYQKYNSIKNAYNPKNK